MKHKLESRLPGEISITSICRWHHAYGRKQRRTKEAFGESERGDWKVGLKFNIQKTKIMASGPITSWQIDGETLTDFIFGDSKTTADGDCSHEIKRRLLLGKKSYDQLRQLIKRQRHYFASKGLSSQSYGFSSSHVWMWELDYKKAESQRIDTFELWYWRRFLRGPWTARRSNQYNLKQISPEYSLEGLMLRLKLQYFGHLMRRTDSTAKTLNHGK